MYEISVLSDFAAAHQLDGYNGKCENLHGHNYKVKAAVRADKLNNIDLGVDFARIKADLRAIMELLDHKLLNKLKLFDGHNPSAEIISKLICEKMQASAGKDYLVYSITVWETDSSSATYFAPAIDSL